MAVRYKHPPKKKHAFMKVLLLLVLITMAVAIKIYKDGSLIDIPALSGVADNLVSGGSVLPPAASGDEDIMQALNRLAQEDSRILDVISKADEFPEPMLALLIKNPEARDFVLNYPEKKSGGARGSVSETELSSGVPYFLQWDSRWGYESYGSCVLGVTGCGPTCLSMLAVGLTGNLEATPSAVAAFSENSGYYVDGSGTSWDLMTAGAENFGLSCSEVPLDESTMVSELNLGHPLIISVGPGDFTEDGHFLVISSYENGMFIIKDPNSPAKSGEGWYYSTLSPQIRNIWSFQAI